MVFSDEGPMKFKWRLVIQKSNDIFDTEIYLFLNNIIVFNNVILKKVKLI